jgi:hypothetical protein
MPVRRMIVAVALVATAAGTAVALAAKPLQPPRTRIYATAPKLALTSPKLHAVQVLMRINPALTVAAGHFNYTDENNTTLFSGLDVVCATTPAGNVFTNLGMPRQHFVLRGGRYRIASTFTRSATLPDNSRSSLRVKLTATVVTGKITGTLAVTGPGCTVAAQPYSAVLLPSGVG